MSEQEKKDEIQQNLSSEQQKKEQPQDFLSLILSIQQKSMENWIKLFEQYQQNLQLMYKQSVVFTESQQQYYSEIEKMYSNLLRSLLVDLGNNTFLRVVRSFVVYAELFKLWSVVTQQLTEKFSAEEIKKVFLSQDYYKMLDEKIFNLVPVTAPKELFILWQNMQTLFYNYFLTSGLPTWNRTVTGFTEIVSKILSGNIKDAVGEFQNLVSFYEEIMNKIFVLPLDFPGMTKLRKMFELWYKTIQNYLTFTSSYVAYVDMIHRISGYGAEEFIKVLVEKGKESVEFKDYNEFFKLWCSVNERVFIEHFKTKEYCEVQKNLAEKWLELRSTYDKLLELYLSEFPVITRSEMNELYKDYYETQKQLQRLQRELKEVQILSKKLISEFESLQKTVAQLQQTHND